MSLDGCLPLCAVCNKPVDRAECDYDYSLGTAIYMFYCHGATQEVTIEDELIEDMTHGGLRMGRCFENEAGKTLGGGTSSRSLPATATQLLPEGATEDLPPTHK